MIYQELVNAARAYADRQDIEVDASLDVFITMAESRINRVLKTAKQSHRMYTLSIGNQEYYSLPVDYNGMRSIQFNTGKPDANDSKTINVNYVTPNVMAEYQENNSEPDKFYYTVIGTQIQFHPMLPHGGTIEINHYRKLIHIDSTNNSNWLLADYPDIYLSGIIAEIEMFVKNYDVAGIWDARMTRSIEELRLADEEIVWAGNTLTTRVA